MEQELKQLGAQDVEKGNRVVHFKGDKGFMYKANLNLRTALRVLKPIAHFQAHDEKELVDINTRLSSAEATWQMAENLYRQLADQVREHSYDIKDLNREINY